MCPIQGSVWLVSPVAAEFDLICFVEKNLGAFGVCVVGGIEIIL